jgi:hypothetical protein
MQMMVCPGMDEAIIGSHINEKGVAVPVYDVFAVIDVFARQKKSQDMAVDWMSDVIDTWDDHVRPIFIEYNPKLGRIIKKQKGQQH